MKNIFVLFLSVGLFWGCQKKDPNSAFNVETGSDGIAVYEDNAPVLFYQATEKSYNDSNRDMKKRAHFVHPLYDLDGNVITEDSPDDHFHHHGVWWAWHQVWVGDSLIGDAWEIRDWQWQVTDFNTFEENGAQVIEAHVQWLSPLWLDDAGTLKPVINETARITVHPRVENYRVIDFEIDLLAQEAGVKIGGADNVKEYSGFSIRIPMPDDLHFTGQTGAVGPENTPVTGGAWMDMSGTLTGGGPVKGVTVMCHPDTPGYPQPWILRSKRSMQNAVYPGREPQPVSVEKPMKLYYRLVVHKGEYDEKTIQKLFTEYKNSVSVKK